MSVTESVTANFGTVEHLKVPWMKEVELRVHVRGEEEDDDDKEQLTGRPTRHFVMSEQSGSRDENTHRLTHRAARHFPSATNAA